MRAERIVTSQSTRALATPFASWPHVHVAAHPYTLSLLHTHVARCAKSVRARDGTASATAGACAGRRDATSRRAAVAAMVAASSSDGAERLSPAMPWMARSPPTAAALRRGPLPNACAHARDEAVTLGRAVTSGGQMCRHGRAHGAITADPSDSGATRVRAWRAWAGRTCVTIGSARSSPSTAATESPDTCEA